jgi:AcrR family transcriptional regulator
VITASGPADETQEERLLRAAERSFADQGFEATKMQEIAAAARVSLRSVYAAASGKTELYRKVHEKRARDLLDRMQATVSEWRDDPRRALLELIGVVAQFLMAHPDFLRIQLREAGAWSMDAARPQLLVAERHAGARLLEQLFRSGIRKGVFHADNPQLMVSTLRAIEQVQLAAWVARRGRTSQRAVIEAIRRQAERLFCR